MQGSKQRVVNSKRRCNASTAPMRTPGPSALTMNYAELILVFSAEHILLPFKTGKTQLLAAEGIKCPAGTNNISQRVF